jgi:Glucokinase
VWSVSGCVAVPSEGGHISLAAHTARESEIIEELRGDHDHLSADRVLSGPGLVNLYRAISDSHGKRAEPLEANDVLIRGSAGSDPIAQEALSMFVTWLGGFAGDAALLFGPRGGVYLGGGIAPKIAGVLSLRLPPGLRGKGAASELSWPHSSLCHPRRICRAERRRRSPSGTPCRRRRTVSTFDLELSGGHHQ